MGDVGDYWREARDYRKKNKNVHGDGDHCLRCGGFHGYQRRGELCRVCFEKEGEKKMGNDDFDEGSGEYWQAYKEAKKERKDWHHKNTLPKDLELLHKLKLRHTVQDDGSGGEKYTIDIETDRGIRTIDWWTSTGFWKVRKGRGEGQGLYRLARYFQLIPRQEAPSEPILNEN